MTRAFGVLRPEPGNTATAARIEARGYTALRLPLFAVRAVPWELPDLAEYDSLLLTSANAVRFGGAGLAALTDLPVHAVGAATATAARALGFTVAQVGKGGVEALRPPGRVLHLAGREHRAVAGAETIVVYASDALATDLSPLAGQVALIHSPRAARALARAIDPSTVALAAISDAAAHAAGDGWQALAIAAAPTDVALIAAAVRLAD